MSAMNYLTDSVGLSAALAGAALMAGKLWDAFVDPFVGLVPDGFQGDYAACGCQ